MALAHNMLCNLQSTYYSYLNGKQNYKHQKKKKFRIYRLINYNRPYLEQKGDYVLEVSKRSLGAPPWPRPKGKTLNS